MHVSPNPIARLHQRADLGLDDRDRLALFVGGDWERKGLRHAVDALVHSPGWRLGVAGEGNRGELEIRARACGVFDRIILLGTVTDMAPVYAAADAFVLPSSYETFSLVTYEAAASGLPLIVSRVSGVEDILEHGVNGWFIDQDPVVIAERLNQLSSDGSAAAEMAEAARVSTKRFSWKDMTDHYLAIYRGLGVPAV